MLKETLPAKVAPHAHEQVAEHRPRNGLVEEANLTLSSEDAEQAGTLDTSPLLRPSKRPVPYGSTRSDATLASHQTHGQRHASRMASSASTAVGEPEDADEDGACRINPRSPKFKTAVPQQAASPSQPSLWSLILIDHVRIVLSTYLFLALCAAGLEALVVLFLYTPVTQGGLGFSSSEIGAVLGATGFATMAVQGKSILTQQSESLHKAD